MPTSFIGDADGDAPSGRRWILPAELVLDASRRLGIASLAMGLVMLVLMGVRFRGYATNPTWMSLDFVVAVVSFALATLCRRDQISGAWLTRIAVAYELLLAFNLSYMEFSVPGGALRVREGGISWACLAIVLFPALVPMTPLPALAAGCAAATMGPLAYAVAVWTGIEPNPLSPFDLRILFVDNYLAGVLAVVPSLVLTKLARDVAEARNVGGYTLERRLGEGGMGEVWEARHRRLARPAAVKLIRPAALGQPTAASTNVLARFEREARATAALRCPHTVVVYDFGTADDGSFYYVMERLDGLDTDTLVERFGPMPPARVVHVLVQACASLEEAHQAGLVHRDVKPANLYLCRMGLEYDFVKLLDFGLVKTHADEGPESVKLSATDLVYGTPAFMAPEQARGAEVSGRTDVYALGCVAYYLLTGSLVFDGKNTAQVLIDQVQTRPIPPSRRTDRPIPPALEAIVMQCLEKPAELRPQSARALAEQLAALRIEPDWTQAQAQEWWTEHLPSVVAKPAAV